MEGNKVVVRGPGLGTLLVVVFVVLKLTGVIAWPWIWVLAPIWIGAVLVVLMMTAILLVAWIGDTR